MSDNLPPDLIPNILARLPLKTVLRCTSVCKSWYSLITSPSFISSHLNLSLSNHESRLLLRFCTQDSNIVKEHYSVRRDNQTFDEIDKLYCPFTTSNGYFTIVGSFNGLLCLFDDATSSYEERIILWNPSLRKSLILPEPRVISRGAYQHAIGFGFLPSTNVYKVVRVVYQKLVILVDDVYISPPVVEIYELGTSYWRNSDAGDCSYVIFEQTSQAFLKDSVHWIAHKQFDIGDTLEKKLVVSFDMRTEKFGAFGVPDALESEWLLSVSTFRESLCLIHHPDIFQIPRTNDFCCIWVMKEYGVTDSWAKQFNIDVGHHCLLRPLCFRENGGILLSRGLRLVAYDPKNNQFKILGEWEDTLSPSLSSSLYVDNYVESLVLIKGSYEALSYPSLLCKDHEVKGCGGIGNSNR